MRFAGLHIQASRAYSLASRRLYSSQGTVSHDPLRILFCGADAFSIYSLRALGALRANQPDKIESIEIVCRSDKFFNSFTSKHSVPIKAVAKELSLPVHQLDTFTGFSTGSNLIITASFGLLVPARLLESAKYGGINVHPSLLPNLRGAAPIQHALLNRLQKTGVSIQTMHPTKFDHGIVLAQQEVDLADVQGCDHGLLSTQAAVKRLGPLGGELLVRTIDEGLFLDREDYTAASDEGELLKAPKIKSNDSKIDWQSWTADEIQVRYNALGQLWDTEVYRECTDNDTDIRMSFDGPWQQHDPAEISVVQEKGRIVLLTDRENDSKKNRKIAFRTCDGVLLSPASATIAARSKGAGLETLQRMLEQQARRRKAAHQSS